MRIVFLLAILITLLSKLAYCESDVDSSGFLLQETDGSPSGKARLVNVTNGTLTDNGGGNFTVTTGGGGGTPGGNNANVQFNDASSFGGDTSFSWSKTENRLSISRDSSQTGYAITISSDSVAQPLANISHDGTAYIDTLQLNTSLAAIEGGTGQSTFTKGDLLVAPNTTSLAKLGVGATGTHLSADAAAANGVSWQKTNLADESAITGNLGVSHLNSGTNASSSTFWRGDATWQTAGSGSPGTPVNSVQFNDASTFAGDVSFNWDKTNNWLSISRDINQTGFAFTISSDSVAAPLAIVSHDGSAFFQLVQLPDLGYIRGSNSHSMMSFDSTASAVNGFIVVDGATTVSPVISSDGSDANVSLGLNTKGTGGVVITTQSTAQQSTINSGLVVNNGQGATNVGAFKVLSADGAAIISSDPSVGGLSTTGKFIGYNAADIGWSIVDQTDNQACNTGCVNSCGFGIANATGSAVTNLVSCTDATADLCFCVGPQ